MSSVADVSDVRYASLFSVEIRVSQCSSIKRSWFRGPVREKNMVMDPRKARNQKLPFWRGPAAKNRKILLNQEQQLALIIPTQKMETVCTSEKSAVLPIYGAKTPQEQN
jgi:hypothetical protein